MYEQYYQLKGKAFSKTPDPSFLYQSKQHAEALARLELAVAERELALLVGHIGCGKTTLSRALIDRLDENHIPSLIINPALPPVQLLSQIGQSLGLEKPPRQKRKLVAAIQQRLFDFFQVDRCPVIIIDEAQLIPSKACFDELRLLTNFQLDDVSLFSLILIGQPELLARLAQPSYDAFRQRIGLLYKLGALSKVETRSYIKYRLKKAGAKEGIFDKTAMDRIFELSQGVPRVINHLATNALLEGLGRGIKIIKPDIIDDVNNDMSFKMD